MDIILKTTDLCKSFKRQVAVNNVSLNIEKNSVYGLLGPNGAGKSTTLKMITGILKPLWAIIAGLLICTLVWGFILRAALSNGMAGSSY